MNAMRGAAWLRSWRGLACLALAGIFGVPGLAWASPGCQALNGQSGSIGGYGYVQLLTNSQQVNQGDYVTFTTSGQVFYGGSFLQISANGNTVSGAEGGSGAGADNLSNQLNSPATYSITCRSAGASISGVSPSSATAGSSVVISGSGFWGATQVLFGTTPAAAFTVNYGGSGPVINATAPNGSGTVTITVVTDAGTYTGGSFMFAAPTANPVSAKVSFGSSNNAIALSTSGNPTSVAVASAPAHGSATASGTSIRYTPTAGYAGSDSFTYTATNAAGTSSPATVSITVNAPTITLSPTTLPGATDDIAYSQTLSASGGTAPYSFVVTAGSLPVGMSLSSSGTLSGTPTAVGTFSFSVSATDAGSFAGLQSYTITVAAPTITLSPSTLPNLAIGTAYSQTLTASGGTAPYTYAVTAGALPAGLSLNASTGAVSGTASTVGTFNFTVIATDSSTGAGPFTSSHAYSVTVNAAVPSAPTIGTATAGNAQATVNFTAPASNGGSAITGYTVTASPGGITGSGAGAPIVVIGLTNGMAYTFTVTATNSVGTGSPSAASNSVTPLAPPTAAAKSVTTAYNTATSINLSGSITGTNITAVTIGAAPTHGTVSVSGETVTYTPSSTYYGGSDSFTYTATNPSGTSAPATVTITIGAPAIPTAAAKSVSTPYNKAASIDLSGSISGVDITAVTIGMAPAHGTVSVSGETVTYTPSSTYYGGGDSFTYTATNPGGTSSPATVTITVGAPGAPTATAKSATTPYNTAASIDLSGSISGIDITAVTIGMAPAHGTVSVSGETVTYTPSSTYYGGSDSFTYTATNPGGTSSAATVTITVGAPVVPTATAKAVTTEYNTAASIDLSGSINGVDITAVTMGAAPTHGTVSISGETATYTPSSTYYGGSDSFTYTATNPGGTSSAATVTITVGAPAVPIAAAASVTTAYNTAASINLASTITGVDITAVTIGAAPAHGTVSVSGEAVTYTPSSTYYGGSDSFTYIATNPGGSSSAATVSVTVTPLSVPVAKPLAVVTMAGTPVLVQAWASATGQQPFTGAGVVTQPPHGSASGSGGQITYVPTAGFVGTDTFGYEVSNNFGHSQPATVTVTVLAAGSVAGNSRTLSTTPGTPVSIDLATIVPDSYVSSTLVGMSPANAGNASLNQPSTLTFNPAPGFHGLVQLSAALASANGSVVSVNVLVLVSSQSDPSKNPDVLGLVHAQTTQAQRFAQSQLGNIGSRLESLHDGGGTALFSSALSVSLNGRPLQAHRSDASAGSSLGVDQAEQASSGVMRPGIGASESVGTAQTWIEAPVADGTAAAEATGPQRSSGGLGVWVGGSADFGSFKAYRQAAGFDADAIAISMGVDQRLGEHGLFGFSLGYNHDNSRIASDGTRSIAHGYSAALYASFQPTVQTYIDAVLGGGGLSFDSRRFDADTGTYLSGSRSGGTWFGSLTAGYQFHLSQWLLSPYGRMEEASSSLSGFSEHGAATSALTYGKQTVRTSLAAIGLRASGQIPLDWGVLAPTARLEIGHDFQGTSDATLRYAFIPSAGSWSVLANPYSANGTSVQLGLGLGLQLHDGLQLTTDYNYLLMPHAHDQMIRLGLNKQF